MNQSSGTSLNRKGGEGRGKRNQGGFRGHRGPRSTNNKTTSNVHNYTSTPAKKQTHNQKKEEDLLIEFMGYLRSGDVDAVRIHKEFGSDTGLFVEKAREFLKVQYQRKRDDKYIEDNEERAKSTSLSKQKEGMGDLGNVQGETNSSPFTQLVNKFHEAVTLEEPSSSSIPHSNQSQINDADLISKVCDQDTLKNHIATGENSTTTTTAAADTSTSTTSQEPEKTVAEATTTISVKWQPKRLYTRTKDQPGKVFASSNDTPSFVGNMSSLTANALTLPPKTEITASWQLPLDFIRRRTLEISSIRMKLGDISVKDVQQRTIQDALSSLTVGLFRKGCSENGSNHAIIAKQIVGSTTAASGAITNSLYQAKQALEYLEAHGDVPKNTSHHEHQNNVSNESYPYQVNQQLGIIHGNVPFFTPRTPGNVVFRLYFEDDPMYTLATSPSVSVRITPNTLEQTLRFILSNFKNKKGSGANLSSIYSLTSVLEQYKHSHISNHNRSNNSNQMDSAGRAAWGGICEARKIFDAAKVQYVRNCQMLKKMEEELHDLEQQDDNDEEKTQTSLSISDANGNENQAVDDVNTNNSLQQKRKEYHMEKNANERKWREVQLSFAALLKSIVTNKNIKFLLKVDIIKKMDLEYQLWCPICESFAPNPFEKVVEDDKLLGTVVQLQYPYPIKAEHFEACRKSKKEMQEKLCDFTVSDISNVYSRRNTNLLNSLSSAMVQRFQQDCQSPDSIVMMEKKKLAQVMAQKAVELCHAFEDGTRVAVFGSSANGFGSPHSDLDMCLEMVPGVEWSDEETIKAMSCLAEKLTEVGMKDVDTSRLTARIPVIKFHAPVGDSLIECDISKANPLACLNTRLLRSYASISPSIRILASVIKRWAKCRNINDPSQHSLSSYGYILMLLHVLTTHEKSGESLKSMCIHDDEEVAVGNDAMVYGLNPSAGPLLPNLQWIHMVPSMSNVTKDDDTLSLVLMQLNEKPQVLMRHPTQDDYMVNTYFVDITKDARILKSLQEYTNRSLPISSLGYVLLCFFHYYAFVFDYKNHVVSLNAAMSTKSHIKRESKAEWDGWRMMVGSSLSIEDPFEEFYDVAHVLKPLNFQHLKREFALAYSKIRDAMTQNEEDGDKLLDFLCQEIETK